MIGGLTSLAEGPLARLPQMRLGLAAAVEASASGIVISDATQPDNPIIFVNPAFVALTGYAEHEVIGRNCRMLQGSGTDRETLRQIRLALARQEEIRVEILNYRKSGEVFWNDLIIRPILDSEGKLVGHAGLQTDVTWKRRAKSDCLDLTHHMADVVDGVMSFAFHRLLRPDGTIEYPYCSPALGRLLELPENAPVNGEILWRYMRGADRESKLRAVQDSARTLSPLELEYRLVTATGKERWIRSQSTPCRFDNGEVLWQGVGIDVTAAVEAEQRLTYLAFHDPLTGLANRACFETAVADAIATARVGQSGFALYCIDIAGFQEITNILGRPAGDQILQQTGERLTRMLEPGGLTARIGEDVFAVLIPGVVSPARAQSRAEEIARDLSEPIVLPEAEYEIETCIGFVIYPDPGYGSGMSLERNSAAEQMKRCDVALYEAKRSGRNTQRLYTAEIDDRIRNRMLLRQSLHRAMDHGEFGLNYQPVVDLASGRIVGAEALVRWYHPKLGLQRPDQFVPLAEETGLIIPLGAWVLETALRQFCEWRRQGLPIERIAVNVSGVQLQRPGFVETLSQALERTGAVPSSLDLELTEGVMIQRSPAVLEVLHKLRAIGCGLTVDDFGTGYSSFQYLRDFPVDKLKIDQTFVRNMVLDSSDASLIRAMIEVARSLDLDVVAEGIETSTQCAFLVQHGCATGQGYLYSMPLDAEDFGWILAQDRPLPGIGRPEFPGLGAVPLAARAVNG